MSRELSQVCRAQTRGEVAGKTRQEEMDVEEKKKCEYNCPLLYYNSHFSVSLGQKKKKMERVQT